MNEDDDYPLLEKSPGETEPAKVKTSVRLLKQLDADITFIAQMWNAFDDVKREIAQAEAGKKKLPPRGKSWKPSSVMELFVQAGRDRWAKRMGGMPATDEDRKTYLREAKKHFQTMAAKAAAAAAAKKRAQ